MSSTSSSSSPSSSSSQMMAPCRSSEDTAAEPVPGDDPGRGHGVTPCCHQLLDPRLALMASLLLSRMRGRDLLTAHGSPACRRLVTGLRQARDLVRSGNQRVLAVFIAYDINENAVKRRCPAREAQLLMTAALEAKTPVSFALGRREMGAALGESHVVSAVAVLDADGDEVLFQNVMQLSVQLCTGFVHTIEQLLRTNEIMCSLVNCVSS